MADDFSEWASDAPLRTPDGFSEVVTAAGVAVSAIERNEMLSYASKTFVGVHEPLQRRILDGYQSAKRLQLLGMVGYVVVALVALGIVLALPLEMAADLRATVWAAIAALAFIVFIPVWVLLCNHVLVPDWNTYATWYRRRDRKGLGFADLYEALGMTYPLARG
ncbi:hypothetical protein [Olsenella sp. An270]|uniref:hypothetical protein n=1 Tax=Olsenella sp. An270 TaxID=1965615 RepID=UPI0011811FA6|nr:hypothetical protein [Olsenella sp. An270]